MIKHCDDLNNESQYLCLQLNCLNQIKCQKNHFLYLKLILLLSEDVNLSPGPIQNDRLKENWKSFRSRGIHFMHLNIISLLPKIDELTRNGKNIKPTVIGITETKIDNSISDLEIFIGGYCVIRRDQKRKGGGEVCNVTNRICSNTKNCISNEIENIFIKLSFQKQIQLQLELFIHLQINVKNTARQFKLAQYVKGRWHILGDLNINFLSQ